MQSSKKSTSATIQACTSQTGAEPPKWPRHDSAHSDDVLATTYDSPLELLGIDELTVLQKRTSLFALLALRMTKKTLRTALYAARPPEVCLVDKILDYNLVNFGAAYNKSRTGYDPIRGNEASNSAHEYVKDCPSMNRAPTRVLIKAYRLFDGMTSEINQLGDTVITDASSRFDDRWYNCLAWKIQDRLPQIIIGKDEFLQCDRSELARARFTTLPCAPVLMQPLTETESIALLDEIFKMAPSFADCKIWVSKHVAFTPFLFAAVSGRIDVVKFLAGRKDVAVHWCSVGGNNAYANVLSEMEKILTDYEDMDEDFPNVNLFNGVLEGETHAQYLARARKRVNEKYEPVLAYLRDDLQLNTRPPQYDSDSWDEEGEREGEEE